MIRMRIDLVSRVYNAYETQRVNTAYKVNQVKAKDELSLSTEAQEFAKVKKLLTDVPDIREDKVSRIKQQIESGTYNVKAEEVAGKMLSEFNIKG